MWLLQHGKQDKSNLETPFPNLPLTDVFDGRFRNVNITAGVLYVSVTVPKQQTVTFSSKIPKPDKIENSETFCIVWVFSV